MDGLFPPVDPDAERGRPRRRLVPFTAVLPNLVTLLGLCAGLTAIRMAVEHRFDLAVGGDHLRHHPRWDRRAAGALFPRHVALRRAARFACRLRQFRRRAGDLRFRLAARRALARSDGSARSFSRSARGSGLRASTPRCSPRSRGRTGARTSSSACRRRPGPGSCCCRSSWSGRFLATLPIAAIVVALYSIMIALLMVSRIPTPFGKAFRATHPARQGAAGPRRRCDPRGAPCELSVLVPGSLRDGLSRAHPVGLAGAEAGGGARRRSYQRDVAAAGGARFGEVLPERVGISFQKKRPITFSKHFMC